jgi:energy-coupling factor transporter ATP-binding protein EcfA2
MKDQIAITALGQLEQANIIFGDITVLVGPQASGKSILLQLIKLVMDAGDISQTLKEYGFNWDTSLPRFLSLYFGEGMQGIWRANTQILVDQHVFDIETALLKMDKKKNESLFLIPAQRVMTLKNGWPRPFADYETGDPYVVKKFSEHLRRLMETDFGSGKVALFPHTGQMSKVIQDTLTDSIFGGAEVKLDESGMRKRIVLDVDNHQLPFMVWSAGQREFVPLLMGLYWLMPSAGATKKKDVDWVVIEEPEMGLHPQAITALLVMFLELAYRGYKVVISTHSPQILEMVWAAQILSRAHAAPDALLKIFDIPNVKYTLELAENILKTKTFKTYYFARQQNTVTVRNISSLDPGDLDEAVSDWGGLTSFSTRTSNVIAETAQTYQWTS